jgi:uncharacterized protein
MRAGGRHLRSFYICNIYSADMAARLKLRKHPGSYSICRLDSSTAVPAWAMRDGFWTITRTRDELSVLCLSPNVPAEVKANSGWALLELTGPFEFTLTGILAAVLNPLADAGVSILALSTFDTDYVLVKEEAIEKAIRALREAGHSVE